MYSAVEEAPPQFVWCDSPIAIHLAMHIVGPTGSSVQRTLEVQLGNPVERMLLNGLAFRKMELTREVPTRMLNAAGRNPAWTWLVGILDGLMGIQLTYLVVTHQKIPGESRSWLWWSGDCGWYPQHYSGSSSGSRCGSLRL